MSASQSSPPPTTSPPPPSQFPTSQSPTSQSSASQSPTSQSPSSQSQLPPPPSSTRHNRKLPRSLPKINTFTSPTHSPRRSEFGGGAGGSAGTGGGLKPPTASTGVGEGNGSGPGRAAKTTAGIGLIIPPTPIVCPPTPTPIVEDPVYPTHDRKQQVETDPEEKRGEEREQEHGQEQPGSDEKEVTSVESPEEDCQVDSPIGDQEERVDDVGGDEGHQEGKGQDVVDSPTDEGMEQAEEWLGDDDPERCRQDVSARGEECPWGPNDEKESTNDEKESTDDDELVNSSPVSTSSSSSFDELHRKEEKEEREANAPTLHHRRSSSTDSQRMRRRRSDATPQPTSRASQMGTSRTASRAAPEGHAVSTDQFSTSPNRGDGGSILPMGFENRGLSSREGRTEKEGGDGDDDRRKRESTAVPRRRDFKQCAAKDETKGDHHAALSTSPEDAFMTPERPMPSASRSRRGSSSALLTTSSGPSRSGSGYSDPPTASLPMRQENTLTVDGMGAIPGGLAASQDPRMSVDHHMRSPRRGGTGHSTLSSGSGHGGHEHLHRRSSSTHRVLETLNAKQHQTEEGQRMVNQYRLGPTIGKGGYATVEKGIDVGTGKEYAIKEFSKSRLKRQQDMHLARNKRRSRASPMHTETGPAASLGLPPPRHAQSVGPETAAVKGKAPAEDPLQLIRREVAVMKKLDHPNIVLLYEAIDVPTSDSLYLVLEYMKGGTVMQVKVGGDSAHPLDPELARIYFRQLLLGLEYLHGNDIAHRDIKPDNVLMSEDHQTVKLCDFGVSEMFSEGDDRMQKNAGSPAFMSPETVISGQQDVHARAVDVWSLGVTLYCFVRGKLPFDSQNPLELFEAIKSAPVPIPHEWDPDLKDIIKQMLIKDPNGRIRMAQLKEHPWVTKHGQEPMPSTEENLHEIGKQVEAPSEEEIGKAISNLRGVFTVIRAVQKMRRLGLARRSNSTNSTNSATLMQRSATLNAAEAASQPTSPTLTSRDKIDHPHLNLFQLNANGLAQDPVMLSPDTTMSMQVSSPYSTVSSQDTRDTSDYFSSEPPSGRIAKILDRSKGSSLPSTRENSGVIDDIDVEKMRTAMDASPEDKALALSLQQEAASRCASTVT